MKQANIISSPTPHNSKLISDYFHTKLVSFKLSSNSTSFQFTSHSEAILGETNLNVMLLYLKMELFYLLKLKCHRAILMLFTKRE
jgi:hypothetical protein